MVLINNVPTKMAIMAGKLVLSGSFTGVIGGTMTCGTADAHGSASITWAPDFITAPIIVGTAFSAGASTTSIMGVQLTAVTVSGADITCYASGGSVNVIMVGEARL